LVTLQKKKEITHNTSWALNFIQLEVQGPRPEISDLVDRIFTANDIVLSSFWKVMPKACRNRSEIERHRKNQAEESAVLGSA
jgi:hypothetical protein